MKQIPIGVGAVGLVASHGQIIFTTKQALQHSSLRPADDFLEVKLEGGVVQVGTESEYHVSKVPRDMVCLPIFITTDLQKNGEDGSGVIEGQAKPREDDHKVTAILVVSKVKALDDNHRNSITSLEHKEVKW